MTQVHDGNTDGYVNSAITLTKAVEKAALAANDSSEIVPGKDFAALYVEGGVRGFRVGLAESLVGVPGITDKFVFALKDDATWALVVGFYDSDAARDADQEAALTASQTFWANLVVPTP